MTVAALTKDRVHAATAIEVLRSFTKLGVSSFGGPIAHVGFFVAIISAFGGIAPAVLAARQEESS